MIILMVETRAQLITISSVRTVVVDVTNCNITIEFRDYILLSPPLEEAMIM